jgi:hypothetical protein
MGRKYGRRLLHILEDMEQSLELQVSTDSVHPTSYNEVFSCNQSCKYGVTMQHFGDYLCLNHHIKPWWWRQGQSPKHRKLHPSSRSWLPTKTSLYSVTMKALNLTSIFKCILIKPVEKHNSSVSFLYLIKSNLTALNKAIKFQHRGNKTLCRITS